jgi:hypothetical protein
VRVKGFKSEFMFCVFPFVTYRHVCVFVVVTAVTMKSSVFCDVKPCSLVGHRIFWRNVSPPSSGSNSRAGKKLALSSAYYLLHDGFLLS